MSTSGRGVPEVFGKVAELALVLGVSGINRLPGCWIRAIDDHWTIAVNGHPERMAAAPVGAMGVDVPPYHVAVWWHGWLAGFVGPGSGVLAAHPDGANEERLLADIDAAIVRAGTKAMQ